MNTNHQQIWTTEEQRKLIASAPKMQRALEIISNFSKCQCNEKHGDNPNCPVLIAEEALK